MVNVKKTYCGFIASINDLYSCRCKPKGEMQLRISFLYG